MENNEILAPDKLQFKELITVNVRGLVITLDITEVSKTFPDSLLGNKISRKTYFEDESKQYIFNRNPTVFNAILDFYNTGNLHIPNGVCTQLLTTELQFWRLSPEYLCLQCLDKYQKGQEEMGTIKILDNKFYHMSSPPEYKTNSVKYSMWMLFNRPSSSKKAQVYQLFYLCIYNSSKQI